MIIFKYYKFISDYDLRELLNPKYQFSIIVNNEKYLIDVESRVVIDLNSNIEEKNPEIKYDNSLTKYKILIHKIRPNNMLDFEDQREFNTMEETVKYINSWKERSNSV